jgi:nitrite reductase/ring-hydroxylating ferredoxin subunit
MSEDRRDDGGGGLVRVCPVAELPPGERTVVSVDGTPVGVLNVDGEYYAIENTCPHQGGPVCQGRVASQLVGEFVEPGKRVRETYGDGLAIACPWHGWEYDLATGDHLGVDDVSLATYEVVVRDSALYVRP